MAPLKPCDDMTTGTGGALSPPFRTIWAFSVQTARRFSGGWSAVVHAGGRRNDCLTVFECSFLFLQFISDEWIYVRG
ncbi:hypothetical protein KSAC_25320 [Komagataeibacter saccharivorans]|nr:hypothetical protein KSAC_25320 [Komagataeibacter saccharivorans]